MPSSYDKVYTGLERSIIGRANHQHQYNHQAVFAHLQLNNRGWGIGVSETDGRGQHAEEHLLQRLPHLLSDYLNEYGIAGRGKSGRDGPVERVDLTVLYGPCYNCANTILPKIKARICKMTQRRSDEIEWHFYYLQDFKTEPNGKGVNRAIQDGWFVYPYELTNEGQWWQEERGYFNYNEIPSNYPKAN